MLMGRYGNDNLNRFLSILSLVFMALAFVLVGRGSLTRLLWLIAVVLLVLVYVRMFSRNVYKRSSENTKYMQLKYKLTSWFKMIRERWVQRKDYKFFSCPLCHTKLRVPRHKGKVNIVCRKCGNSFQGKT